MLFGGETAESYYDEGLTASMKGDFEQAIGLFERAIQLDNSLSAAYHQLGKCYLRLGKAQKAVNFISQVTAKRPNQIPAQLDLANAYLALNDVKRAQDIFEGVVSARPTNPRGHLGLAQCAFELGRWDETIIYTNNAINTGGSSFGAFFLLGRAALAAGNEMMMIEAFQRADAILEKAIESSPEAPEAYYFRGELYFAQGDFPKALEMFQETESYIKSDKHYAAFGAQFTLIDVLAKQAICHKQRSNMEGARAIAERIVEKEPGHPVARAILGAETDKPE